VVQILENGHICVLLIPVEDIRFKYIVGYNFRPIFLKFSKRS